jgi:hypothetical protein
MKILSEPSKLLMLENVFILLISDLVEIIHVQLSDKRREIAMSEVNRQDFLLKFLNVDYNKVSALLIPCDNI